MASSNTILPPGVTSDAWSMTTGLTPPTYIGYGGSTRMFRSATFSAIVTFKDPDRRKDLDSFRQFVKQLPGWFRYDGIIEGFSVAEKEIVFKKINGSFRRQEIVPTGIISPGEYFIWVAGSESDSSCVMFDWDSEDWTDTLVCLFREMVIGFPKTFSAKEGFFREVGLTLLDATTPASKVSAGPIRLAKEDDSLYDDYMVDSSYIPLHNNIDCWSLNDMKAYFDARKQDVMAAMRDLAEDESISFSELSQHLFFGERWLLSDLPKDMNRLIAAYQHCYHPYREIEDRALRGIHVTDGDNYEKGVAALRGLMAKALLYPHFEEEIHYLEDIFDTYTTVPQELLDAGAALKFTIADVNAALSYFTEEDITKVKRRIQGLDWARK